MRNRLAASCLGGICLFAAALAAQPTIAGVSPTLNRTDAPRNADVVTSFSSNMKTPQTGSIVVRGSYTGVKGGSVYGGGSTQLTFDPTYDFRAGEQVEVSLTTGLQDASSTPLAAPYVYRFRAATVASPGTFQSEQYLTANNVSDAAAAGDFDGDGDIDFATAMVNGQNVVYFNDGAAGFSSYANWGTGTDDSFFIRAADMNGDGISDLVVLEFTRLRVYLGSSSGTLMLSESKTWQPKVCSTLSLADMNGDGAIDVVIGCTNDQGYRPAVILGNGNGTLGTSIVFASNTINYWAVETADLDNDGDIDVMLAQESLVEYYLNDGAGNMTLLNTSTFGTSLQIEDIELFDIDKDGDIDCMISAYNSECRYGLNDGSGNFGSWTTINSSKVTSLATGDFDGDGYIDVVAVSRAAQSPFGTRSIWFNNTGTIGVSGAISLASGPTSAVALADFDGDRMLDLAVATGSQFSMRKDYVRLGQIYEGSLSVGSLAEPTQLSSAAGAPVDVFDFLITDLGSAPGNELLIDTITVGISGVANDCTWKLHDGGSLDCTGVVGSGQIVFHVSQGLGYWYSIPNSSAVTFTMSVEVGTSTPAVSDGHVFSINLTPNGVWFRGGGQFALGQPTIDNGSGLTLNVAATELRVAQQPPSQVPPSTAFPLQVEYTDVLGYRDLDVTGDTITLIRSDAGTINQGGSASVNQGLADFSGGNAIMLGAPENTGLQLVCSDDAGGSLTISGSVNTQSFALLLDDGDSLLTTGAMTEPSAVDSIAGAATSTSVLDFRIIDVGTADGKPTIVTDVEIDLAGSSADGNDATWSLTGVGVSASGTVSGAAGSQKVLFSGVSISVTDGNQQTFHVGMQLAAMPFATRDGDSWTIVVRTSGLTINAASSTSFATGQPGVGNTTAPLKFGVTATELVFTLQPPVLVVEGAGFPVMLEFRDVAGNLDLDVDGDVVSLSRSDAGTIASGASAAAVAGIVDFSGVSTLVLAGAATGIQLVATDGASGVVDLNAIPVPSMAFDVTAIPSSGGGGDDGDENCTTSEHSKPAWWALCLLSLLLVRRREA